MPGWYMSVTIAVVPAKHWWRIMPRAGSWRTAAGTHIRWVRCGPLEWSVWRYKAEPRHGMAGSWGGTDEGTATSSLLAGDPGNG